MYWVTRHLQKKLPHPHAPPLSDIFDPLDAFQLASRFYTRYATPVSFWTTQKPDFSPRSSITWKMMLIRVDWSDRLNTNILWRLVLFSSNNPLKRHISHTKHFWWQDPAYIDAWSRINDLFLVSFLFMPSRYQFQNFIVSLAFKCHITRTGDLRQK